MPDAALIVGAGDGLGTAIARRFAREGLHVVAARRRGDLAPLVDRIRSDGGQATARHTDARDERQVAELVRSVEAEIGPLAACVFNVGGNVRFGIAETTPRVYRKVWEMCAFAGFLVGREAACVMRPRARGTILFTGASASVRGQAGFAAFAGGKHALRALAQSMSRELGPEGIHVAHVIIDGLVENEATSRLFPEAYRARGPDGLVRPEDAAEAFWHLHAQPRTVWTSEMDLRPFKEPW
ncbi:SDR family NAD(P)-dependent oxidoreductase [Methylobacterium sp. J-070]|uniref:SDR family NAD(P)-dependent oxidoreductase n=1 Tax=Methylobacterium sp. J-070 TaxID=2836650 RepID=UPI001FBB82DA|nr:SDR family NAD(P)-dependent oxidoreductase [Methylobacterium sp. J-070]MCJ2048948.1 SDR family NAD(P)-dependent oxidoreductase [Methylobacterium sp. J-070]